MNELCYPVTGKLLTVIQAKQQIFNSICSIDDRESIGIEQALGRILAEDIVSAIDVPPQRNSAMDGYAFASRDLQINQTTQLHLAGYSWAGKPFSDKVFDKHCVRIFTGAVVPDFADSVIAQEQVQLESDDIILPIDCKPFQNIRAAGSDVKQQQLLIQAPKVLTAVDLGLLASAGITTLQVKRRLKVGFFSTGDELIAVGATLNVGQIYDSNRHLLNGLLSNVNYTVTDLGIIKDDRQLLEQSLSHAAEQFDVLISTGGASVGEADFIQQALQTCGQVNFWKLAIKPGKPLAFGKMGSCWFFGLPGNPVAVLVTFKQFVKPALIQLQGAPTQTALQLQASCLSQLRKSPGRQEYQRGILSQTLDGQLQVASVGEQDSHQQKTASMANCFIVLPPDCAGVQIGQTVTVEPFDIYI